MPLLNLTTKEEFEVMIKNHPLCLVHFYADWVDQCVHMDKILAEMANLTEYKLVRFIRIPAEDVPEISLRYKINAVPTFILLSKGEVLDRVEGANPSSLISSLKTQVNGLNIKVGTRVIKPPVEPPPLEERLKKLVNSAPVMLFMKGDAAHPRCGFSTQMVQLLDSNFVTYKTFDILNDNEVREGLKKFSNWPTYPQLYINGELIGGLDIVKELIACEELKKKLPDMPCLQDRLRTLINLHPVMLFMKGNREEPRCGFSRKIVQILDSTKVSYETFDILGDEEIRQGLKKFSNWPTYPQVYVKGELIGGLDVIVELQCAGQLIPTLTQAS
uniref:Putative glutaredoxin-related protein n=1 Tax=Triatoma dimidiata TaxID=72491 RepID=A0A0V0G8T5_TRIDM